MGVQWGQEGGVRKGEGEGGKAEGEERKGELEEAMERGRGRRHTPPRSHPHEGV